MWLCKLRLYKKILQIFWILLTYLAFFCCFCPRMCRLVLSNQQLIRTKQRESKQTDGETMSGVVNICRRSFGSQKLQAQQTLCLSTCRCWKCWNVLGSYLSSDWSHLNSSHDCETAVWEFVTSLFWCILFLLKRWRENVCCMWRGTLPEWIFEIHRATTNPKMPFTEHILFVI